MKAPCVMRIASTFFVSETSFFFSKKLNLQKISKKTEIQSFFESLEIGAKLDQDLSAMSVKRTRPKGIAKKKMWPSKASQ